MCSDVFCSFVTGSGTGLLLFVWSGKLPLQVLVFTLEQRTCWHFPICGQILAQNGEFQNHVPWTTMWLAKQRFCFSWQIFLKSDQQKSGKTTTSSNCELFRIREVAPKAVCECTFFHCRMHVRVVLKLLCTEHFNLLVNFQGQLVAPLQNVMNKRDRRARRQTPGGVI